MKRILLATLALPAEVVAGRRERNYSLERRRYSRAAMSECWSAAGSDWPPPTNNVIE